MSHPTPTSLTASLGSKLTAATCPASFGVGPFIPHSLHDVIEPLRETSCAHNLTDNSGERARAFYSKQRLVLSLEKRSELLRGKAGYRAMLGRLTVARCALLKLENELNR